MTNDTNKKIIIVTTGQPSTNPRVVKEYKSLKQSGYNVKVLYCFWANWAIQKDEQIFESGELTRDDFILVGGSPFKNRVIYFISRLFYKVLKTSVIFLPFTFIKELVIARPALFLLITCSKYKADLYVAHYLGALPAAVKAAKKNKAFVIFDAEDYHRGESEVNSFHNQLSAKIENKYIPRLSSLTTASPLITEAYQKLFKSKRIKTINNVFSVKFLQPFPQVCTNGLRLFWFSQTAGINRGLEIVISALNKLETKNISLTILAYCPASYQKQLKSMCEHSTSINFIDPVSIEEIFKISAANDIGLTTEIPYCINRNICLTNKLFTYLLSGNCIIASNTEAQRIFLETYKGIGLLYQYDDPYDLASKLQQLYDDREFLLKCRRTSYNLAKSKLNWENESDIFLSVIESTLV